MPANARIARSASTAIPVDGAALVHEVLLRTVQILISTGHSAELLDREYAHVRREVKASQSAATVDATYLSQLTDVLSRWQTEAGYVDARSEPVPLPLEGPGRSLAKLIRTAVRHASTTDVLRIARSLVQSGSVRRGAGLYRAVEGYVSFAEERALAHTHTLDSVRRYLRTVQHNLSSPDAHQRWLERSSINARVPTKVLPTIHRRFKREAGALLSRMDRYVRRFQSATGRWTTVGLHAYASEDPTPTTPPLTRKAHRRQRAPQRRP